MPARDMAGVAFQLASRLGKTRQTELATWGLAAMRRSSVCSAALNTHYVPDFFLGAG